MKRTGDLAANDVQGRDAGVTLVETMVAMVVFTACFAVFIGGLVVVVRDTTRTQAVSAATDQLRSAFTAMDREARYAESVNAPGAAGGAWWVEFQTPAHDGGTPACTQWRYDVGAGVLEERTWDATGEAAGTWRTTARGLATDPAVLTDGARAPFRVTSATSDTAGQEMTRQTLTVHLEVPRATGDRSGGTRTEALDTTFTAMNSSAKTDGILKSAVCSPSTTRVR
ncbi:hypothetical protein [Kineococcus indalonis]|uniref:hypothetical protein n=1 Tax=Kineococcus indalonis TaxID=2696566 RepID=UPI00141360AD|nr:hypothetical protein [Kineococcus indalonis]NAZ84615.1 hypothetical protein [Kineococcus indalonis]